jgi:hypothetical protein
MALNNDEEIFREIELKSVAPLFAALGVGFVAAITVLVGEMTVKYVLSKIRGCN